MPKQLKIAMISFHSCPLGILGGRDTGGMNVYIRELARELGSRGHTIDIYTRAHQPGHDNIIQVAPNTRLIHIETGGVEEIPKVAFYSYIQNFICATENFRKASNVNYDFIYSHYWLSALAGQHLQLWWKIPHLVMFHTLAASKNRTGIGEEEPELRIESEREIMRHCDRIIASTDAEKVDLVKYYSASPENVSIIPCGVNTGIFKPIEREKARKELGLNGNKIILFIGRMEPLKGAQQLLSAFSTISELDNTLLIIAGGDEHSHEYSQVLQQITRELNIMDKVSFTGPVAHEKLPLFYNAADISVIPSYYESFGLVALESLACGTPVIGTNVGALKSIINIPEAGAIIENNSPGIMAKAINSIFAETQDRDKAISLRRTIAAKYDWKNIADKIIAEYCQIQAGYDFTISNWRN